MYVVLMKSNPDEACFLEPDEWIPERFTTRPELILNKSALVPWTIGKTTVIIWFLLRENGSNQIGLF